MKIYNEFEQGSYDWYVARLGIPTASDFSKIITPVKGEFSKSAEDYADYIIGELIAGEPTETFQSGPMKRGKELEPEAVAYYEARYEVETQKCAFCTDDNRTMGCSVDRFVGEDGILEVKALMPQTMVKSFLRESVEREHYPQIMGQMLITGRKWLHQIYYHPNMPKIILPIQRDEPYIALMEDALAKFKKIVDEKKAILIKKGYMKEIL